MFGYYSQISSGCRILQVFALFQILVRCFRELQPTIGLVTDNMLTDTVITLDLANVHITIDREIFQD